MKVMVLDRYYGSFLRGYYEKHPGTDRLSYAEQHRLLMQSCFGTADFYSRNLQDLGHEATEVVTNCRPMQSAWAREQGVPLLPVASGHGGLFRRIVQRFTKARLWEEEIALAQIRSFRPDVVHIQDMNFASRAFLEAARAMVSCITGQIACPYTPSVPFDTYDMVFSSLPNYVERLQAEGIAASPLGLGFEPRVLAVIGERERDIGIAFVGGISTEHSRRRTLLEALAQRLDLRVWGYGGEALEHGSALAGCHRGEAWGVSMYDVLARSNIVVNHHIDIAENYANNMRLYEATGMGTLLLTDAKSNLHELFDVGAEVCAYRDVDECVTVATELLADEPRRARIASAGQRRTLSVHTYRTRMEQYLSVVEPLLARKAARS